MFFLSILHSVVVSIPTVIELKMKFLKFFNITRIYKSNFH